MSDLMELLERVKAATGPDRELEYALVCHFFGADEGLLHEIHGINLYRLTASIDAALALVERKLPGWVVDDLSQNSRLAGDPWGCKLASYYGSDPSRNRSAVSGYDYPTAPLAILAALLSALTSGASS